MDAKQAAREARKQELLRELAEIKIEELREQGVFSAVPHYSVLEQAASALGKELSCLTQQRAAAEVRAESAAEAACPSCGAKCSVETKRREVASLDGQVTLDEASAYCRNCRRSFFPSAD